jgi:hypothetical protein
MGAVRHQPAVQGYGKQAQRNGILPGQKKHFAVESHYAVHNGRMRCEVCASCSSSLTECADCLQ